MRVVIKLDSMINFKKNEKKIQKPATGNPAGFVAGFFESFSTKYSQNRGPGNRGPGNTAFSGQKSQRPDHDRPSITNRIVRTVNLLPLLSLTAGFAFFSKKDEKKSRNRQPEILTVLLTVLLTVNLNRPTNLNCGLISILIKWCSSVK